MESINTDADTAPLASAPLAFSDLGLSAPLLAALTQEGYVTPTPIQSSAIPQVLAGRDLLGCAQTGTGKTAAFALPILQRLSTNRRPREARRPRALVLSPTRELAAQIRDSFVAYGRGVGLEYGVIFGGVAPRPQVTQLTRGVDVLIATPGRLLDLMNQGAVLLDRVEVLVLDEADRMLDMGFLPDVRRILAKVPKERQSLLFSATMPRDIRRLAADILVKPAEVEVTPAAKTADRIEQVVYMVDGADKRRLLVRILRDPAMERAIVFTRTKHGANRLVADLSRSEVFAEAIHGNKSQGARQRALDNFKTGRLKVLVATDIAARGIDVDGISHVVNYDLPNVPESYVHRIGRTARAGAAGVAISLCGREERGFLRDIERLTRAPIKKLETPVFSDSEKATPRGEVRPDPDEVPRRDFSSDRRPKPAWQRDPRPAPRPQAAHGASSEQRPQGAPPRRPSEFPRASEHGRPNDFRRSSDAPRGDARPRSNDFARPSDRPRSNDFGRSNERPSSNARSFSNDRPRPQDPGARDFRRPNDGPRTNTFSGQARPTPQVDARRPDTRDRGYPSQSQPQRSNDDRPRRPWDQTPGGDARRPAPEVMRARPSFGGGAPPRRPDSFARRVETPAPVGGGAPPRRLDSGAPPRSDRPRREIRFKP
ncbi:MAG TPA: DEAD/DEAH box helicase [Polyangiaceae bacterium]